MSSNVNTPKATPGHTSQRSRRSGRKEKPMFQAHQHAVYKTKTKAKKFFGLLDKDGKKRINKTEFCQGLRLLFDSDETDISDLGIELLWEQQPKDPTNRYCSVNDFITRFTVNKGLGQAMGTLPVKPEAAVVVVSVRKMTPTDLQSLRLAIYYILKGWRYQKYALLKGKKSLGKKGLSSMVSSLLEAERTDAKAYAREVESFAMVEKYTNADFHKIFDSLDLTKPVKNSVLITTLEKLLPSTLHSKPAEYQPLDVLLARVCVDVELQQYVLTTVSEEYVTAWVADVLFLAQRHSRPHAQLRVASDKVFDGPVVAYPALAHWTEEFVQEAGVQALSDPKCTKGSLVFFTNSVNIHGVYSLPPTAPVVERSGIRHVAYVQHLYGCESEREGVVIQWRIRAKVFLDETERPVHVTIEDSAAWINGEIMELPKSDSLVDFEYPDIPFQTI